MISLDPMSEWSDILRWARDNIIKETDTVIILSVVPTSDSQLSALPRGVGGENPSVPPILSK